MISNGCLAIVYFVDFVEIIWCVKMTSKANPPEIVRKSAEACAELIYLARVASLVKGIKNNSAIFVNGNQKICEENYLRKRLCWLAYFLDLV
jgi:hypothetical protein